MSVKTIPAHVPVELVVDIDIYAMPDADIDPHTAWRGFQGRGPLAFSPYNGGHWVPTTGADVTTVYRDTKHFSSRLVAIPDPDADVMLPIQADPPVHSKHRANIQGMFTQSAVNAMEDDIRALTVDLIEAFRARGECEFVSEFSLQLPILIFLRMMGLPDADRPFLRERIEIYVSNPDIDAKIAAHKDIHQYLGEWVERRIAEPRDDAITQVTQATIDGRRYTKEEMVSTLTLLLHAGLDTVTMMLGFIVKHLAEHPDDRDYVKSNDRRMHAIVQELIRRYAGPNVGRVLSMDYDYKGVTLKKGDRIILVPSLFNLDESKMTDPDRVDFERDSRHITFGTGIHTCAGALLARKEIAVFLQEWLALIPEFETDLTRPPKLIAGPQSGVMELWLKWNPEDLERAIAPE